MNTWMEYTATQFYSIHVVPPENRKMLQKPVGYCFDGVHFSSSEGILSFDIFSMS